MWTQGVEFARQALYHLGCDPSLILLWLFLLWRPGQWSSHIAGITDVTHPVRPRLFYYTWSLGQNLNNQPFRGSDCAFRRRGVWLGRLARGEGGAWEPRETPRGGVGVGGVTSWSRGAAGRGRGSQRSAGPRKANFWRDAALHPPPSRKPKVGMSAPEVPAQCQRSTYQPAWRHGPGTRTQWPAPAQSAAAQRPSLGAQAPPTLPEPMSDRQGPLAGAARLVTFLSGAANRRQGQDNASLSEMGTAALAAYSAFWVRFPGESA
jgi:hypothetical protein